GAACINGIQNSGYYGYAVSNVVFSEISNSTSPTTNGHVDYTCSGITSVTTGTGYQLSIDIEALGGQDAFHAVYIDYNDNGTLDDTDETVMSGTLVSGSGATTFTTTVTIPVGATTGKLLRMRVINDQASLSGPCDNLFTGEAEDYSVLVSSPCSAPSVTLTDVSVVCYGESTGSVTSSVSGGQTPYTYLWSNAAITDDITGILIGTYSVTVTENQGCTTIQSATVSQPTAVTVAITATNPQCVSGSDGSAACSPTGGTIPYTYLWSDAQTIATATGLSAGVFQVTVKDANLCTVVSSITLTSPVMSAPISPTHPLCVGNSDGSALCSPTGGATPYTYLWNSTQTKATSTGLSAGVHSVTVTDNNSCIILGITTLTDPVLLTASVTATHPVCNGSNNGSALCGPSGGATPYTYLWNSTQTTINSTGLSAGIHTVTVTDNNSCTAVGQTTLTDPTGISIIVTAMHPFCVGASNGSASALASSGTTPYTYLWSDAQTSSNATGLLEGVHAVTISDANSCSAIQSTTLTDMVGGVTLTPSATTCNGKSDGSISTSVSGGVTPYTYLWSDAQTTVNATGLLAGNYTVTVTDVNLCSNIKTSAVTEPTVPTVTITGNNVTCNGMSTGSATTTVSGGTTAYTYAWSTSSTSSSITGLTAGTYSLTVSDANSCTVLETVTITEPTAVTVSLAATNVDCYGQATGSILATLNGGVTPYTYLWSNGSTIANNTGLPAGNYTLTSTDANSCVNINVVAVTQVTPLLVSYTSTDSRVGSGSALSFGGTDYITTSNTITYNTHSVSAWLKTTNTGLITVLGASEGANIEMQFYLESGKVKVKLIDNTPLTKIYASTSTINDGNWHHIAYSYDAAGDNINIYVDGVLDSGVETANVLTFAMSTTNLSIGSFPVGSNNFVGEIDELVFWEKELTQTEVRTEMCKKITSAHSSMCDLLAYYRFDENSGTTLKDWFNTNDGIFVGAPSYVLSGAAIGNASGFDYSGATSNVNLAHPDGDDLNVTVTAGTPSGLHLYRIDNMPDSTNGIDGTDNNRYFGVYIVGSGATYTATYDYDGHTYGVPSTEASLMLFGRQDNSIATWADKSATLNTTANTLEVTGVISTANEYIIHLGRVLWTGSTDTDWGTASNWSPSGVPISTDHITIPDVTNKPILDTDRSVGNISIETNSSISLGTNTLSIVNSLTNNGSVIPGTGTISFIGSDAQIISGSTNFTNLTINNTSGGVTVNSGQLSVTGTLSLTNGLLTTNDSLTLESSATGTARVAEITGGTISGKVTCERYIPSSNLAAWRRLCSPVSGVTLADWNDDFITSGFPGSDDPTLSFVSIYTYDETVLGGVEEFGWTAATGITDPINVGEGYTAYINNVDTVIDVTGTLVQGDINLNVSYTSSGVDTDDGWTIVANPYMSTIDWDDADWVKTNMNNAIYIWDHFNGVNASYVDGVPNNGGGPLIASSQAFVVQVSATLPVLTAKEGVKNSTDHTFWRRSSGDILRLALIGNGYTDQTTIVFKDESSENFDSDKDARKFANPSPASNFSSTDGQNDYSINSLPYHSELVIPLKTIVSSSGTYR
ncbi:MAG: hypothetical protein JKY53_00025, partial [Flavobacteriales bacterium]|nr:hypothetical protein [Flavobacteriales bacterium]